MDFDDIDVQEEQSSKRKPIPKSKDKLEVYNIVKNVILAKDSKGMLYRIPVTDKNKNAKIGDFINQ